MDIIATIGPAGLAQDRIDALIQAGATIFRINGAHTPAPAAVQIITELRRLAGSRARIMMDLPTNKVRTANMTEPIVFEAGDSFQLHPFQLNYPELHRFARVGDEVVVNNGLNHMRISALRDGTIELRADAPGRLGNNRGLIFTREVHTPDFPYFFPADEELIEVINDLQLELVGLSFLRYPSDKEEALRRIRRRDSLVFKIETRVAFANYAQLIFPGERILLDRGDLAGEIGLIHIPQAQDRIIRFAHRHRVEIYLATQFLASMESFPVPHIAEVCALYDTIKLGISGIQLSEETAVGKYPAKAIEWIRRIEALVHEEGNLNLAR